MKYFLKRNPYIVAYLGGNESNKDGFPAIDLRLNRFSIIASSELRRKVPMVIGVDRIDNEHCRRHEECHREAKKSR